MAPAPAASLDTLTGTTLPPTSLLLDATRMAFFARSTGETNPVFFDLEHARAAGHATLPAMPTFLFGVELEQLDPFGWLREKGVDVVRMLLHGEQRFVYHSVAHAGDTVVAVPRVTDVYAKKALTFVVKETALSRADGSPVADLTAVLVVRGYQR